MNHRTKGEIVFVIIVFVIFAPLLAACGGEAIPPTVAPLAATPALSTFTPAPVAVVTQPAAPASTNVRTFAIDATQSEARFFINEVLFGAPSEVKGATNQITGAIDIDLDTPANTVVSQIVINARELKTDRNLRDRAIRRFILQSADDKYQFITFTPTNITGLPAVTQAGDSFSFEITGDLQIRDIVAPTTFAVTLTADSATQITGLVQATVQRTTFGLQIPSAPGVADVSEDVRLELAFVAQAE
jgi:polyisoprenoid-binding protein YceI